MPSTLFIVSVGLVAYAGAVPLSFPSSNSTMPVPSRADVVHTEITQLSLIVPRTVDVTSTPTFKTQEAAVHTEYTADSFDVPNKAVKTHEAAVHTEYTAESLDVPNKAVKTEEAAIHTAASLDVPEKARQTVHTEMTADSLDVPEKARQTVHTEMTAASLDIAINAAMTAHTELTADSLLIPRATIPPAPVAPRQLENDDDEAASGASDEEYSPQPTKPAPEVVSPLPKHGWFHIGRFW